MESISSIFSALTMALCIEFAKLTPFRTHARTKHHHTACGSNQRNKYINEFYFFQFVALEGCTNDSWKMYLSV